MPTVRMFTSIVAASKRRNCKNISRQESKEIRKIVLTKKANKQAISLQVFLPSYFLAFLGSAGFFPASLITCSQSCNLFASCVAFSRYMHSQDFPCLFLPSWFHAVLQLPAALLLFYLHAFLYFVFLLSCFLSHKHSGNFLPCLISDRLGLFMAFLLAFFLHYLEKFMQLPSSIFFLSCLHSCTCSLASSVASIAANLSLSHVVFLVASNFAPCLFSYFLCTKHSSLSSLGSFLAPLTARFIPFSVSAFLASNCFDSRNLLACILSSSLRAF